MNDDYEHSLRVGEEIDRHITTLVDFKTLFSSETLDRDIILNLPTIVEAIDYLECLPTAHQEGKELYLLIRKCKYLLEELVK